VFRTERSNVAVAAVTVINAFVANVIRLITDPVQAIRILNTLYASVIGRTDGSNCTIGAVTVNKALIAQVFIAYTIGTVFVRNTFNTNIVRFIADAIQAIRIREAFYAGIVSRTEVTNGTVRTVTVNNTLIAKVLIAHSIRAINIRNTLNADVVWLIADPCQAV